ncbi:threonine synthase [Permianibacter sp. IMCC34836]|uniref:threonine synthase n=1 Tax=Permianibacter fluminis TaxID=2738515 RepID=UPI0015552C32|nr:threonine synthase [Permianibacter fluminis]NQD36958.1 threonine synthase [Permianibacter fluminis]
MKLYNLKHSDEQVSFRQAVLRSIGRDSGLFYPTALPRFADVDALLAQPFVARSQTILDRLLGEDFDAGVIPALVERAFTFPAPVHAVSEKVSALELFHGPTLAFKDFGARFMAQVMAHLLERGDHQGPLTIVSATSGDTGAAVAHAFYGLPNIQVVILYPKGRISSLQEKLFCTLGGNIRTLAVDGDFDSCQALVKQCFTDREFVTRFGLNSANSINIARLIAQSTYYFEALAQLPQRDRVVISVPSGNFGNLTAGLFAQALGLPVHAFVASTNANDTVPRYLQSGIWNVRSTVPTLSNAMDVSAPNNWPRIEELFAHAQRSLSSELRHAAITEPETLAALRELDQLGYLAEPHAAVAYASLKRNLHDNETGLFLCTAHPAKFKEAVESTLNRQLPLPAALAEADRRPLLSHEVPATLAALQQQIAAAWQ